MASPQDEISACGGNDPCAAGWQAAYVWHSDQLYKLAVYQALQQVAFGALEFASNDRTADLQYDIADRQMSIAEEEYARYKIIILPGKMLLLLKFVQWNVQKLITKLAPIALWLMFVNNLQSVARKLNVCVPVTVLTIQ